MFFWEKEVDLKQVSFEKKNIIYLISGFLNECERKEALKSLNSSVKSKSAVIQGVRS